MLNAQTKIDRMAKQAVHDYVANNTEPGEVIYQSFKKEANYNFNHIKRACEQANIGVMQDVVLKCASDRGKNFPLADPVKIATALNIKVEKVETPKSDTNIKTASDMKVAYNKFYRIDTTPLQNLQKVAAFIPKEPLKSAPTQTQIEDARKIAASELRGTAIRIEERHKELTRAIKEASSKKDLSYLLLAINKEYNNKIAGVCADIAAGLKLLTNEKVAAIIRSEIVPENYIPGFLKVALDNFSKEREHFQFLLESLK